MLVIQNQMNCHMGLPKEGCIKLYSLALWYSAFWTIGKSNSSLFKSVKTFPFKALHNRNSAIMKPTRFKAQLDQFNKWEIRDDCL